LTTRPTDTHANLSFFQQILSRIMNQNSFFSTANGTPNISPSSDPTFVPSSSPSPSSFGQSPSPTFAGVQLTAPTPFVPHPQQQGVAMINPPQQPPSQPVAYSSAGQKEKLESALDFLDQVKTTFDDRIDVYNQFLDIMKDFKAHKYVSWKCLNPKQMSKY